VNRLHMSENTEQLLNHKDVNVTPINPIIFPIAGFLTGIFIWVLDAFIDVYILGEEQSLLENILSPDESSELWMRTLVLIVFIIMGLFSRNALKKHIQLDKLLLDYQHKLEEVVTKRTEELLIKTKELESLANYDTLTGLYNRRKFTELLENEMQRFERYKKEFSLISLDIDHFKQINDTYGHDVGDIVLKGFSDSLNSSIRTVDSVGRWGGEEFLILIIESNRELTIKIAEKIQANLNQVEFDSVGKVTASIGVTEIKNGDSSQDMIKRADQAMYIAKENGRNRIESLW